MKIGRVDLGVGTKSAYRREVGLTLGHNHWAYNLDVMFWKWYFYVEIAK